MAETRSVQVEGIGRVSRALKQVGDDVNRKALTEAHRKLAKKVVAAALPYVPVGPSGRLKRSVRDLASPQAARGKAGNRSVPYAAAVHWGTGPRSGMRGPHNIKRTPFLQNAVWHVARDAVDVYAREIQDILDRFSGRH